MAGKKSPVTVKKSERKKRDFHNPLKLQKYLLPYYTFSNFDIRCIAYLQMKRKKFLVQVGRGFTT
jgi:hypothetical protein